MSMSSLLFGDPKPAKLAKLTIKAFKKPDCGMGSKVGEIKLQINPEEIVHDHQTTFTESDFARFGISGSPGAQPHPPTFDPEKISFTFYLDDSGMVKNRGAALGLGDSDDIVKAVAKLKKLCYQYDGDIHGPHYLQIIWGSLFDKPFKCRMQQMDVSYTLFKASGKPLRAKVTCSFVQFFEATERLKSANPSSPDLSHIINVRMGDNLPTITNKVYEDPALCVQVARHNRLTNLFRLNPGDRLQLPPIEK